MALNKSITFNNGVIAEYWNITSLVYNKINYNTTILLTPYVSVDVRKANIFNFIIGENKQYVFQGEQTIESSYDLIKTSDNLFSDAVNV